MKLEWFNEISIAFLNYTCIVKKRVKAKKNSLGQHAQIYGRPLPVEHLEDCSLKTVLVEYLEDCSLKTLLVEHPEDCSLKTLLV